MKMNRVSTPHRRNVGNILNALPPLHVRSPPHRVILHIDHHEPLPLPKPDRPWQKRMGMQVQAFDALRNGPLAQCSEQCSGQPVAAVFRKHEQTHDFDHAFAVIIELAEAVVIRQVTDGRDQSALITGFQKVPLAVEIGCFEMTQVFG